MSLSRLMRPENECGHRSAVVDRENDDTIRTAASKAQQPLRKHNRGSPSIKRECNNAICRRHFT